MKYFLIIIIAGLLVSCASTKDSGSKDYSQEGVYPAMDEFVEVDEHPMCDLTVLSKNVKYPDDARKEGIEGKVMVRALVDINGKVAETFVEHTENEALNDAAVEAVKKTEFESAVIDGKPINCWVMIPIVFKLK